ncbi:hypothetical protein [Leifsonia shinshuensis]
MLDGVPLVVPPGVPLRVADWLLVPVLLVVGVLLAVWFEPSPGLKVYFAVVGTLVFVAAWVQAVNGYRVYSGWSGADILRYRRSVTGTCAVIGIFCLFGDYGVFAFVALGYRLAADPADWMGRVRSSLTGIAWIRLTVVAGITAAVATVARPLGWAVGGATEALTLTLCVVASITAGFAFRSRPLGHRFF